MSKKSIKTAILSSLILFAGLYSYAQDGAYNSYSPYSVFGIGDVLKDGPAYSRSRGGVGIASRSHRFVNYMNPAAVSAAGKNGEAMVAFIGQIDCVHGIALALHDSDAYGHYGAGTFYWGRAHDVESSGSPIPHWITNHPINGATWRLPSKTDWQVMMLGCRLEDDAIARADVMEPVKGFKQKLDAAGASLGGDYGYVYWTGDGDEDHKQWVEFDFYSGGTLGASFNVNGEWGGQPNYTRLCLSF